MNMKKVKWTPLLIVAPTTIVVTIIRLLRSTWTPFSLFFIILIPLIMGILLLLDRAFTPTARPLTIWIVEIIIILIGYIWLF